MDISFEVRTIRIVVDVSLPCGCSLIHEFFLVGEGEPDVHGNAHVEAKFGHGCIWVLDEVEGPVLPFEGGHQTEHTISEALRQEALDSALALMQKLEIQMQGSVGGMVIGEALP